MVPRNININIHHKHMELYHDFADYHQGDNILPPGKQFAIENGPVEIVGFPMKNGGSFHMLVYQRVICYSRLYGYPKTMG